MNLSASERLRRRQLCFIFVVYNSILRMQRLIVCHSDHASFVDSR